MIKKAYKEIKVSCFYYPTSGTTPDHCEGCQFFGGLEKGEGGEITGVDCLRSEIPSISANVRSFEMGGYLYRIKKSPTEDSCQECCFARTLRNGNEVCLLRCGVPGEFIDIFGCQGDEVWEKVKL